MTKRFEYLTKITSKQLDFLGHVNNACYLEFLEEARWDAYSKFGYSKENAIKEEKAPIVLENNLKYRKELLDGEEIKVSTEFISYRGQLSNIKQVIYKQNGKRSCIAEIVIGYFDLKGRKLIYPSGKWKEMNNELYQ